jgi:hypothetical protein
MSRVITDVLFFDPGRAGMGSEIGKEGADPNYCGGGSERKEERRVRNLDPIYVMDIYSYFPR